MPIGQVVRLRGNDSQGAAAMLPRAISLAKKQKQRKRQYQFGRQKIIEIEFIGDRQILTLTSNLVGAGTWVLCNATGNGNGYARYQVYIWDGALGIGRKIMDFNGNDTEVQNWIDAHPVPSQYYEIFPYFFSGDWLHLYVVEEPQQMQVELICGYYQQNDSLPGGGTAPYTGWNIAYRLQPDMEPRQFSPPPGDFINSWWRIPRLELAGATGDHRDTTYLHNTNALSTGTVPYVEADRVITQGIGRKVADAVAYVGTSKMRYAALWTGTDSFDNPSPPADYPSYDASPATAGWRLNDRGAPADYGGVPSFCWGNTANEFYHFWAYRDSGGTQTDASFFRYNKGADTYTKIDLKTPFFTAPSYRDRMLESNTFIGYARSHASADVSEATGEPGNRIDFFVGTTWGSESILFSFVPSSDIDRGWYRYTATAAANMDQSVSADDEFSKYYEVTYFTCLDATAGKRKFLFVTGNYNADKWEHQYILGYPPAVVLWKEETGKFELLYVHPYPKGRLAVYGDHAPILKGCHAEGAATAGDYGVLVPVIAYDYNGDATPNDVLWKFLNINVDTGEVVDLLNIPFKKPAHLGGGSEKIDRTSTYNPVCIGVANLQFAT